MSSRDQAIAELIIMQEIRDITMRYARGMNRLDPELIKSCFHDDAKDDHGPLKTLAHEIADQLPQVVRSGFQSTFHLIGNSLIEIQGSRAFHEAYVVAYHRLLPEADGTQKDLLFGGRYLSIHETRGGSPWLIAARTVIHDWNRIDKVSELWPGAAAFAPGAHSDGVDPAAAFFHRNPG